MATNKHAWTPPPPGPLHINIYKLHSMSWCVQIVREYTKGKYTSMAQQTVFGSNKMALQVGENLLELMKIKEGNM